MIVYKPLTNKIELPSLPVIFLAGPCASAIDWQNKFIDGFSYLENKYETKDVIIANPRMYDDETNDYQEQIKWESYYLNQAGTKGVISFWLSNEIKPIAYRSFARTTRFELGEWYGKLSGLGIQAWNHLALGIDSRFEGSDYIEEKFKMSGYIINHEIHGNLNKLIIDTYTRI